MKTLYVSHDCGCSYHLALKSESIDEIIQYTKRDDMKRLRWYIEDEVGNMDYEHMSPIHRNIIETLKKLSPG